MITEGGVKAHQLVGEKDHKPERNLDQGLRSVLPVAANLVV